MTKNKEWARVFTVWRKNQEDQQVLFVKRYNAGEDADEVTITFMNEKFGAMVDLTVSFDDEENANAFFVKHATMDGAKTILENGGDLRKLLGEE